MQQLQDIEQWLDRDPATFADDILDAFQYHTAFGHPLYARLAAGEAPDHRELCYHAVALWRMSKLARLQLTQLALASLDELAATSPALEAMGQALGTRQIDQARSAINGLEELIAAFDRSYGAAPLPDLLKVVEDATIAKFFDRVDKACWSERLGWSVASDCSWTHAAAPMAAALAHLALPSDNPFCHPGRYVVSTHRTAQVMPLLLTNAARRAAFVRGVLDRNAFHCAIWDGFALKFGTGPELALASAA
jgi:hypothetical protein